MDRYNIKIIGDKVYVVKGTLFYAGNIVDFQTSKEGITELTIEEVGSPIDNEIKVSPGDVFYNTKDALCVQIDRCKKEIKRLRNEAELVESYSLTAQKRLQR